MTPTSSVPIGIGTYGLDAETCREAVRIALETGYRHVDTAQMYENESAVGAALEAASVPREDVFVATKVHSNNLAYEDVLDQAERSRDRLGIETIDLLYVHWPINAYEPTETLAAFDTLYADGVIAHVGLSNFTPRLLEEALQTLEAPLFAHQVECHPYLQQRQLRRIAREHGHFLVAYSPLAKGSVLDDPVLRSVANRYEATPAQVALAWLQSKEAVVPIPKSSQPTHIRENFRARTLGLDRAAIERIDGIERTERQVDFPEAPWNPS